jgi:hypothetical protein
VRWPGVCLALLLAGVATAGPRDIVADCARRVPPGTAGLEALEAECPELRAALDEIGVRPLLSPETRETILASSLAQAVELMAPAASCGRRAPDPASLAAALRSIGAAATPEGWWERFKAWLLERLARPARAEAKPDWADWLAKRLARLSPSQALLGALYVALLAAVVIAAVLVIINELRAAGVLRARPGPGHPRELRGPWPGAAFAGAPAPDGPRAPERARLLLQQVVERLTAAGRLTGERSLTHRELAERARLDDEATRLQLARLAALAERQLFGAASLPDSAVEPVLAGGEALFAALGRPPGRPA